MKSRRSEYGYLKEIVYTQVPNVGCTLHSADFGSHCKLVFLWRMCCDLASILGQHILHFLSCSLSYPGFSSVVSQVNTVSTIQCPHYSVHTAVSTIKCTHYSVHTSMSTLQCSHYNVDNTVSTMNCPHYSAVSTIKYSHYSVHTTV